MQIIKESNISRIIIISTMIIISSVMFFNGYFFIAKQYELLDSQIEESRKNFINTQRNILKREVDSIIEYIAFKKVYRPLLHPSDEEALKNEIYEWIRTIRFGKDLSNYLFVYGILNLEGGDNFATMLINPNRPDLEGELISDDYTDDNGKAFRKIFLQDIHEKGYSFVDYVYKKPGSTHLRPKVSYFKFYEPWGLVIAAGAYLDEIDEDIEAAKASFKHRVKLEATSAIIIFLIFTLIANSFAVILGRQIEKFLNSYNAQVKQKTEELEMLNKTLESRVQEEIQKGREQEQLLIQKSKFIALGEMISNIAHQWRQPLSQLSALLMTLKLKHRMDKLDKNAMDIKCAEAETIVEYMSHTIDDFRNFFMPNKDKKEFSIKESVEEVLRIIGTSITNQNIAIEVNIPRDQNIIGYKSEYEQVILNLLSNAKDAIIATCKEKGRIVITLKIVGKVSRLSIHDNGGGIKIEPLEKIFEPYMTTKDHNEGTGIGLYMAKLIIEKSMKGKLEVQNKDDGAIFTVEV